jgi:hypothetical protein
LFLRIIAWLAQARRPMTVAELAQGLGAKPEVVAECIGRNVLSQNVRQADLPGSSSPDYWIPRVDETITRALLDPASAGAVRFVDMAIAEASTEPAVTAFGPRLRSEHEVRANQHVVAGEGLVSAQLSLVTRLEGEGIGATRAKRVLLKLRQVLNQQYARRAAVVAALRGAVG